jgi:predicted transglutaminase-like cysteine proteinase
LTIRRRAPPEIALRRLLLALLLALAACCAAAVLDPAALQRQLVARFGPTRVGLLNDWLALIRVVKPLREEVKLQRVNDFVNRTIGFADDLTVWQQDDYWATPLETIGQGRGDCEDFTILKYVSLRMAGVADSKLRLIYVNATLSTPAGPLRQAHMVLAYYAAPNAEPLVLDNLDAVIRPASARRDLRPVFSFNSEGIYAGIAGSDKATAGGIRRLSRWEDALRRIREEGYE